MGPNGCAKDANCDKMVKQIKKKRGFENMQTKMTKQSETQTLQSMILVSPLVRNRCFYVSRFA